MKTNHELAGIEVLRFLCAFGVLIWHYQHFFFVGEWNPVQGQILRPTLPLYHWLFLFYDNGSLAVPVFWVISGFIFYWHYSDAIRDGRVLFGEFLLRRFSRLYPLHFVTLIFVAIGQHAYSASHKTAYIYIWNKAIWFASQLIFASNWFDREPESFNGPIWSVSIEILIYLLFFLISRTVRPGVLSGVFMAAVFAACIGLPHTFMNPQVFACGLYFFAGGVAQRLTRYRYALPVSICTAAATLGALSLGLHAVDVVSVLLLAGSSVIVFVKLGATVVGIPFRSLGFLGNSTYSSYLLHFPIQLALVILVDAIGWKRDIFYNPGVFIGFMTLTIGLSLLAHRYFEVPSQRAIRSGVRHYLERVSQPGPLLK
jgi:peptidoglycan/LPS O-acetylase OafA/YrhL